MNDLSGQPPTGSATFHPNRRTLPAAALHNVGADSGAYHRETAFEAGDALIMMVDDELLNIEMTQAFLEDAGFTRFVSTHESENAVELMRERMPHVLLLDLSMPKVGGMDILAVLRDDAQLRHIPVIVLTSNADAPTKLRALGLGAMDFLAKPVDPSELALRLRNTLAARAHRDYLAQHDTLTGLRNRLRYMTELQAAVQQATERRHGCAVLHIGVDRLAQVNDALGRAAGDTLLQRMGKRLRGCVESAQGGEMAQMEEQFPTLYRFDGDEFAILVPFLDEIESVAGFITSVLESATSAFRTGDREVFVTASVGVAVFPMDGQDANELITNAGLAMRHAKQSGRNTYEFFSEELNAKAVNTLRIGGDLRRALGRDEIELVYQPKIDVRTGILMGCEAVPRWTRPDGAVLEGAQVLHMAGTSEMALVLAEWMLEHVGRQITRWQREHLRLVPVGLNLSLDHFPVAVLMETVAGAIKAGADAGWLCLELDDLDKIDDLALARRVFARFGEWGLRVALDSFGGGGSGLHHLGLPIHEIKVDPALMWKVDENPGNAAIMQAVIAMANAMNITVVATGVHSLQQLAFLKNHGAAQCQGKLFNNPMPADEFAAKWLNTSARAEAPENMPNIKLI